MWSLDATRTKLLEGRSGEADRCSVLQCLDMADLQPESLCMALVQAASLLHANLLHCMHYNQSPGHNTCLRKQLQSESVGRVPKNLHSEASEASAVKHLQSNLS